MYTCNGIRFCCSNWWKKCHHIHFCPLESIRKLYSIECNFHSSHVHIDIVLTLNTIFTNFVCSIVIVRPEVFWRWTAKNGCAYKPSAKQSKKRILNERIMHIPYTAYHSRPAPTLPSARKKINFPLERYAPPSFSLFNAQQTVSWPYFAIFILLVLPQRKDSTRWEYSPHSE